MKAQQVVITTCAGSAFLCVVAALGWWDQRAGWTLVDSSAQVPMPGTIFLLAIATLALVLTGLSARAASTIMAGLAALGGCIILADYAWHRGGRPCWLCDELLQGKIPPPHAACAIALLGFAIVGVAVRRSALVRAGHALALLSLSGATFVLVAYFFGAEGLYYVAPGILMSPVTAAAIALLCLGVLSVTPRYSLVRIFYTDSEGGELARRFLPFVFGAPLVVAALVATGLRRHWYSTETALALLAMIVIVVLGAVTWRYALNVNATEARLEREVQHRTRTLTESITELEEFGQALAHDVRGPLINLREFLSILSADYAPALPDEAKEYLARAMRATKRVDYLTMAMLRYGELSRRPFRLGSVDLVSLTARIVAQVRQEVSDRAEITISAPLGRVWADEAGLAIVLFELLSNACRFAPPGDCARVTISSGRAENGLRLMVRDRGLGVKTEFQDRIFHPFEQLVRSNEHAGIGLALVKRAVTKMHGHVGVESDGEHGSTFWIELPCP